MVLTKAVMFIDVLDVTTKLYKQVDAVFAGQEFGVPFAPLKNMSEARSASWTLK